MIELIQITNDPDFAARCDRLPGMRLFVDLERHGKAERQAGRSTFISSHVLEDVGRVRAVLRQSRLMVRVNPLHERTADEVDAVLEQGCDLLMLPMFERAAALQEFCRIVDGRRPVVALLETAGALHSLNDWIDARGVEEVFIGLNDLHLSLGLRFMFEPLASGVVESVARAVHAAGLRLGFGGVARLDEGLLPGRLVLAEHVRLGSRSVILSRTFHRADSGESFEQQVRSLREAERVLAARSTPQVQLDTKTMIASVERIRAEIGLAA
ncbi:aldolase/citrate lyase family protein [Acidovorax lacteus]|uniref:HpcH/HpaI aldolase/citrate lyase domain-containing protein n=1 Tax=Acidovorax lacteus TaxID=1924988 RepID=A0ABP8LH66_9BURK